MARPREFDEDDAIAKAMNVFWSMGYETAALPDLLTGMGLTRGSLYKAFKGKKPLFLKVLEKYDDIAVQVALDTLQDENEADGLDRIEKIFRAVAEAVRSGDDRGCLMCATAGGAGAEDADITDAIHAMFAKMRMGFEEAMAATDRVQLSAEQRAGMANALLAQYVGLRTMARSQIPAEVLDQSVDALMAQLRGG